MTIKKILFLGLTALFSCALGLSAVSFTQDNKTTMASAQVGTTTKEEDATIIAYKDASNWNFRTLHFYDVSFVSNSGYTQSNFENFLTVYYGSKISSWNKEGTTRGWGLNNGTAKDYFLCDGSTSQNHSFEFPWWVKGFYFQVVNNSNWIGGTGNSGYQVREDWGYHSKLYFNISNGSLGNATKTDNVTYAFPAITVNKVAVHANTKEVLDASIEEETSIIFNTYPNGSNTPTYPSLNGYKFSSWYTDPDLTTKYTKCILTTDTTLYAAYSPNYDENTFYLESDIRGWDHPEKAGVFKKNSNAEYLLENVSFSSGEKWKVKKGSSAYLSLDICNLDSSIAGYMTKGENVVVSEEGANYQYNVRITLNDSGEVTAVDVELYYNMNRFCNLILSKTGSICGTNYGNNGEILKPVWNELYEEYNHYRDVEKKEFKGYNAYELGSVFEQAAARYDYICSTYGSLLEQNPKTYDYNFAERSNAAKKSQTLSLNNVSDNTMIVFVVISAISVLSVGGLVLLKKKRAK